MRKDFITILLGICVPLTVFASNEGVPSYYGTYGTYGSNTNANRAAYGQYQNNGYMNYNSTGAKQVVNSKTYTYQVPGAQPVSSYAGTMTTNGVARPTADENGFYVYGGYGRRFADFQFTTSVNSILEWDDMIFNEFRAGARYNFTVRNFDLSAFGEYTYGKMASGGLSMDYDLLPYDTARPNEGIFTISMGDQSGYTNHMRFGVGAHNIWDIGGWKLTPVFGYEVFKHNLQMSDHIYPNPGVYIPLMTFDGNYVFGDPSDLSLYYSVPIDQAEYYTEDYYQVCVSPEQIKVATVDSGGGLSVSDYVEDPLNPYAPWGVGVDECVIIGGDGPIMISGKTHEYNTTWSGFFIGLEVEKQMTLTDKLRFYAQVSMPKYSSDGIWPNRTDWQQNPSFVDEGNNGAFAYAAELEYELTLSNRLRLSLKADTNYFHVDAIGGKIYWAEYTEYQEVPRNDDPSTYDIIAYRHPAFTETVSDALKEATWQSFGLHLGIKYSF